MYMVMNVSEHHLGLRGKYQGQRYLKSVVKLIAQNPFIFERVGSYIIQ